MTTPALPICPQCKQTDQVQKVSSLYGLNTKEWIETSSYTDNDGQIRQVDEKHQAHTLLGLKLKPPERPASPSHPGIGYGLVALLIFFLLSTLCPIIIVPILIVAGVFSESNLDIPDLSIPSEILLVAGGLLLLVVAVAFVAAVILLKRRYDRALVSYREKKTRYERQDLPNWESAMRRWTELYLCLRDETVFRLGGQQVIRLDDLQEYLSDPYYRS